MKHKLSLLVIALILSGCSFQKADARPLGIRNNNPLNIRHNPKNDWKGRDGTERGFVRFESPEYGIRAASIILKKKIKQNKSLSDIISSWAPASENNTSQYISFVSSKTGIAPTQKVKESDLPALIEAMIKKENSVCPYSRDTIKKGISLS